MSRLVCLALCALVLFGSPAFADDDPIDTKRIQVWKRGETTKEVDVTDFDRDAAARLAEQLKKDGFELAEVRTLRAFADGKIDTTIWKPGDDEAGDRLAKRDAALRKDLRELIRRGGRFPDGYKPEGVRDVEMPGWWTHGSRDGPPAPRPSAGVERPRPQVLGRILKRYLEVKDDPVKGPVYEEALEIIAETLLEADDGAPSRLGMALMPMLVRGLRDERRAAACVELMELFENETGSPRPAERFATRPPVLPPPERRPVVRVRSDRLELGGAPLTTGGDAGIFGLRVGAVPGGSVAAEMTLREGDLITAIDGKELMPGTRRAHLSKLRSAERIVREGGQLTLRLRRKGGETETLEIEFARETGR